MRGEPETSKGLQMSITRADFFLKTKTFGLDIKIAYVPGRTVRWSTLRMVGIVLGLTHSKIQSDAEYLVFTMNRACWQIFTEEEDHKTHRYFEKFVHRGE